MKQVNTDIKEQLRKIVGMDKIPMAILGTVVSIDTDEMTCEVEPVSGQANFLDVRIMADNSTSGVLLKPAIDSIVIIAPQSEDIYYIALVGEVSEIWLKGEQYGGLVKVSDLVDRMNLIESDINTLKTAFSTWVTVPNDGGAALKGATATWYGSQLVETTVSDLENENCKHG